MDPTRNHPLFGRVHAKATILDVNFTSEADHHKKMKSQKERKKEKEETNYEF